MKYILLTIFAFSLLIKGTAQESKPEINWVTLDKVEALEKIEKRPILVDYYTTWCGYCKVMDKKTFTNKKVIEYVNNNFYAVKFDAQSKDTVTFFSKEYPFGENFNMFSVETLSSAAFPTINYFDFEGNKTSSSKGYKKPGQLLSDLKAIIEE